MGVTTNCYFFCLWQRNTKHMKQSSNKSWWLYNTRAWWITSWSQEYYVLFTDSLIIISMICCICCSWHQLNFKSQVLTSFNVISTRLGSFDRTSLTCTKIWKSRKMFNLQEQFSFFKRVHCILYEQENSTWYAHFLCSFFWSLNQSIISFMNFNVTFPSSSLGPT